MDKATALKLIDDHRGTLVDPVELLNWTWLRVILYAIPEAEFEGYLEKALEVLSK